MLINSFGIIDKTLRNYRCIPLIKLFELNSYPELKLVAVRQDYPQVYSEIITPMLVILYIILFY